MEKRFTRAIVRQPGRSMVKGLTTSNLGTPDYDKALEQHAAYVQALHQCGLTVVTLPADEDYPDSTFVEDTALLTPACAIIMRPGAESRRGETVSMEETVRSFYSEVYRVDPPGTADAGDIMMVGTHYYIGLSERTNLHGAQQIIDILHRHLMSGSMIRVGEGLHLKSGLSYLENGNVLTAGAFKSQPELSHLNRVEIDDYEQYAANSLWINGKILVPSGYPKTERSIKALGYSTIVLDVSEFRKLDGGLSCLSLRF